MNVCATVLKTVVFVANLIFFLTGLLILVGSVYGYVVLKNNTDLPVGNFAITFIVFMILGLVIMGISFFGCCGAVTG